MNKQDTKNSKWPNALPLKMSLAKLPWQQEFYYAILPLN